MTALPVLVSGGSPRALDRIPLDRSSTAIAGESYSEAWLQGLIQHCPEVLPISEIEPGFGRLLPVATEVPCGHGVIDNLFVTQDGGIAIVETKLWRNPEARREVVSQALDYAAALGRMSYSELERAALAGRYHGAARPKSLYEVVACHPGALDEAGFIDSVSRNLRRGRMLVIAAGDGIRTEAEALAELLQSHAGARFTFALVAVELYRAAGGEVLAVPRTIAKTVLVERGVVRIEDERISAGPPPGPFRYVPVAVPRETVNKNRFLELRPAGERTCLTRSRMRAVFLRADLMAR